MDSNYQENFQEYQNNGMYNGVSSDDKMYSVFMYLGLFLLITLFSTSKHTPYVKKHINNGLTVYFTSVAVSVVSIILSRALVALTTLSATLSLVFSILSFVILFGVSIWNIVIIVMNIIAACTGSEPKKWIINTVQFVR